MENRTKGASCLLIHNFRETGRYGRFGFFILAQENWKPFNGLCEDSSSGAIRKKGTFEIVSSESDLCCITCVISYIDLFHPWQCL